MVSFELRLPARAMMVVAATGMMALAAHLAVPLPLSPVPLALTPFAVLVIGMLLGPAEAAAVMVLYLMEGALGLPVFAPTGPGGVAQLLGPTGGFLLSYVPAAAVAGWLASRSTTIGMPLLRGLAAGVVATSILLLGGAAWLAALLHLDAVRAWQLAAAPFLPGEALKIAAAALVYQTFNRRSSERRANTQA